LKTIHSKDSSIFISDNTETEKAVIEILKSRWISGREKYGKGINYDQHTDIYDWLDEAIEEAADMLQYLVAMKIRIDKDNKAKN